MATSTNEDNTFALRAVGNRLEPITEAEARVITTRWDREREENDGKTLVEVDLSCRTFKEEGAAVIAQYLAPELVQNVKIARLDDVIASLDEDTALKVLGMLCDCFRHCDLTFVNLSENALGNKGLSACDSVLGQQSMLEELHFFDNGIAAESMEVLEGQLVGNQHLQILHFFNNNVGEEGSQHFAEILRTCPNLQDIRYSNVRASIKGGLVVAKALEANTALDLTKLDLGCATFLDEGLDSLVVVLRRSNRLVLLNLEDCGLDVEGMEAVIAALLESGPPLKSLDISLNMDEEFGEDAEPIAPACCDALGELVRSLRNTLEVFRCETNGLSSYGVEQIMSAFDDMETPPPLRELHLSDNALGHRAAVALAEARPKFLNLETLVVSGNGFSQRDITRLQEAFGNILEEIEDNDGDADYDREMNDVEDDAVEADTAAAEEASQEEDEDQLAELSQRMAEQRI